MDGELGMMGEDDFAAVVDNALLRGASVCCDARVGAANQGGPCFVCLTCMQRCHVDINGERFATDTSLPDGLH